MKKLRLLPILSTALMVSSLSVSGQQKLILTGEINADKSTLSKSKDWVYLYRFDNKIFTLIDSAKVKSKRFSFNTKLVLPELYGFSVKKEQDPTYLFLDRSKNHLKVDIAAEKSPKVTLSGSGQQDVFIKYRNESRPDIGSFITEHPDDLVSSYVLYREWSYRLPPEQLEELIGKLSPLQQQSRYIKELKEIIRVTKSLVVGAKAPDIVAADTSGKSISLYQNLSRYTLIDFWASWCGPCRRENPNIVANFHKYKDQGFGIFAVSLDKTRSAWLKGIQQDGLAWTHVSELKYWDSAIAAAYAVRAIPSNYLVDEHGIIVAKNVKGERLGIVLDSLFNNRLIGGLKKDFKGQDPISYVSTVSTHIDLQKKGAFSPDQEVFFSNDYAGARLSTVSKSAQGTYEVLIQPENQPINHSPWYGFQVWSTGPQKVQININYPAGFKNRYFPKISLDGKNWKPLEKSQVKILDSGTLQINLAVSSQKVWISAQENIATEQVYTWIAQIGKNANIKRHDLGKTAQGRSIYAFSAGNPKSKKSILVIGRQHPPEVTGHYAYASFVDYLLGQSEDAIKFRDNYQIYFVPVVNPDGVDLGHWRHNAGGVDLNRDWDAFNQPESRAVRDFLEGQLKGDRQLYFAIDFHSTGSDIFYTVDPNLPSRFGSFVPDWIGDLKAEIKGYSPQVKPLYFEGPTYTAYSYFYKKYNAESLVYEIGDDTDLDFIALKSTKSAKLLLSRLNKLL